MKNRLWSLMGMILAAAMLLTACGPAATPEPTEAPAEPTEAPVEPLKVAFIYIGPPVIWAGPTSTIKGA